MSRLERGILGVVALHALNNSINADEISAAPEPVMASAPQAAAAPSNPMSNFANKPVSPAQPASENLLENIELDEETRSILANAAGNARKEIFKSEKETPRIPEDAAE